AAVVVGAISPLVVGRQWAGKAGGRIGRISQPCGLTSQWRFPGSGKDRVQELLALASSGRGRSVLRPTKPAKPELSDSNNKQNANSLVALDLWCYRARCAITPQGFAGQVWSKAFAPRDLRPSGREYGSGNFARDCWAARPRTSARIEEACYPA